MNEPETLSPFAARLLALQLATQQLVAIAMGLVSGDRLNNLEAFRRVMMESVSNVELGVDDATGMQLRVGARANITQWLDEIEAGMRR